MAEPERAEQQRLLEQLLSTRGIRVLYQPLVELDQRQVVGYDALARGPEGSPLESPLDLLQAGRAAGRVEELDWRMRAEALQGAIEADLGNWLTLFVTVEPEVLLDQVPTDAELLLRTAEQRLRVVLEIGQRSLHLHPAELLTAARWARQRFWGVALDDVGEHPLSLALLPLLDPDVIKLDLRLVQRLPGAEAARLVHAIFAHVERTGAGILAEGIETEAQYELAVTLGATLGQGWLFGRPGPLPRGHGKGRSTIPLRAGADVGDSRTPFAMVEEHLPMRMARGALMAAMTAQLEAEAERASFAPVVLSTFADPSEFGPKVAERYRRMAAAGGLVAALGADLGTEPTPGVRGGDVARGNPLADERTVIVIAPFFTGAVVSRCVDPSGPPADRRYRFGVTHDPELVLGLGRSLMGRVSATT